MKKKTSLTAYSSREVNEFQKMECKNRQIPSSRAQDFVLLVVISLVQLSERDERCDLSIHTTLD